MLAITRTVLILAAVAGAMYVVCCAVLFATQRSFIYTPQRSAAAETDTTFELPVDGIRVLISTHAAPGSTAVIYFGGNGEDVSQSIPTLQLAFPDASLYALHYRGYNGSTGSPSEISIISDALALYDRVHAIRSHIVMIGRSLGSGVAVHVASMRMVDRLILITPYDSLEGIAASRFPLFPVRWLLLDRFDSWRYAPSVTAPTLLLAAEYDQVIPLASTRRLYEHFAKGRATLILVPDAGHNTISDTSEYIPLLRGDRVLPGRSPSLQ